MQQILTCSIQGKSPCVTGNSSLKPRVLVSDSINQAGIDILSQIAQVDVQTNLPQEELIRIIPHYDALMIRSGTQVTKEVIKAGSRLQIVGRAGVGVDNVDVYECTDRGIVVVNSPEGNTLAAAEHTIAMMLALSRCIPDATQSVKNGKWERKSFLGSEVNQKALGIIGLGKIGFHVATIAQAMGMKIVANDPFVSSEKAEELGIRLVDLNTLLREADYISLHVPKTPKTIHLIDEAAISLMKPTTRIINCSRGGIIDEAALVRALEQGKIAGAALDVYEVEPLEESFLRTLGSKVVLTPHLGASTKEAQIKVAVDVAEQIRDVFSGLPARSAINIPVPQLAVTVG